MLFCFFLMICSPIGPGIHIIAGSVCQGHFLLLHLTRVTCLMNASVKSDAPYFLGNKHMISDCKPCLANRGSRKIGPWSMLIFLAGPKMVT